MGVVDPIAEVTGVYLMFLYLIDVRTFSLWSIIIEPGRYVMHSIHSSISQRTAASQIYVDSTKKSSRTDSLPNQLGCIIYPFHMDPLTKVQPGLTHSHVLM